MAYSTETELTSNVKLLIKTFTDAAELTSFATERIALADKIVKVDLAKYVSFNDVPDDNTTPVINLLSQYKAAEMSLRRVVGAKRRTKENDDVSEWRMMYEQLRDRIIDNDISVQLADGTDVTSSVFDFTQNSRKGIRPAFGYGEYGEWINDDDLYDQRGDVDDSYEDVHNI